MNIDDLIGRLSADPTPVSPVPSPARRAAVWLLAGLAYLGVVVAMIAMGMSSGGATVQPLYVLQQLLAVALGVSAAYAGFASVVPGLDTRVIWPMSAAAAWVGVLLWGCARDLQMFGSLGLTGQTDWPCVLSMVLGGGILWGLMAVMMRPAAPVAPRVSALLAGMAALSIANVEACLSRSHAFSSVVLLWHGGTMAVMAVLLAMAGRRVIRWPAVFLR